VQIEGADSQHDVRDVTFRDVAIRGSKLTNESAGMRVGQHVTNVRCPTENE
jgi:hypothetical protein